jgi:prevent-host-death family protein
MATQSETHKATTRETKSVTLKQARLALSEQVDLAHHKDAIVPITKHGKEYAALIGLADLQKLRKLERKTA